MKLSYQILKKLILEEIEIKINKDIAKLRGLAYDLSLKNLENLEDAKKLLDAHYIYQRALKECEDEKKPKGECSQQTIIDYYEVHFPKLSSQQRQALEEPDVLIRVDDMISGRDNIGRYVGAKLFTYDTTTPDFRGIPLGVLRVYPALRRGEAQVGGSFLGDENFNLPYDEAFFVDNRNSPQTNWEILDWLNEKLDVWIRGKDENQRKYIEFILNA